MAIGPRLGTMCSRTTPSSRSNVERRRSVRVSTHLFIQSPMLTRARVGSMYRPLFFATSTDARNSSASRLVRKPRLSVCL
jgi:hypothetical protein